MESRNEYYTTQRIGNTLFKVRLKFASDAHETMEDKIIRMIRNEVLEKPQNYQQEDHRYYATEGRIRAVPDHASAVRLHERS